MKFQKLLLKFPKHNASKKAKLFFVLQLLMTLILSTTAVTGTLAFLVDSVSVTNNFTIGTADVEILEPGVDPDKVNWGTNTKVVTVSNPSGNEPGVLRVFILPVLKGEDHEVIGMPLLGALSEPVSNMMVLGDLTLHFDADWETYWFYRDGIFYYRHVLNGGETASHLLTGVTLTNATAAKIAEYQRYTVEIDVSTELIQSSGGAPASIFGVTVAADGTVSP